MRDACDVHLCKRTVVAHVIRHLRAYALCGFVGHPQQGVRIRDVMFGKRVIAIYFLRAMCQFVAGYGQFVGASW